ncbi:hypothetical protein BC939DRAFT_498913 [Gamsiella multidivaricata]|uniref:uncharacterized protein n=1 Tax=Gamsiella multidivaricata TaxID=101098 RepID=UPI00221EFE29|nr:uncharacterized protein BC939DRAFT_498913 [Gamsiella multidivaricata]KAI7831464.1 hypothetical protein BC939DRAFT_498913 [Gamsiella multidivaricata]
MSPTSSEDMKTVWDKLQGDIINQQEERSQQTEDADQANSDDNFAEEIAIEPSEPTAPASTNIIEIPEPSPHMPTSTSAPVKTSEKKRRQAPTAKRKQVQGINNDQALKRAIELMYKKQPSPFAVNDLSESYWARESWPLLMELLDDVENMYMLDGEKMGVDPSRRRNQGRSCDLEEDISRKRVGRKLDWTARDILTIMQNRFHETQDDSFQKQARFFGIYIGDRGFQAFELRPADGQSYVTLFHLHHLQELPVNMNNLKIHFQGLTKLIQIRATDGEKQKDEGIQEENDMSWLYDRREDLNVNLFLASSPGYP